VVDISSGKASSAGLALTQVTDVHELGRQLTNAEWMNSMPGRGAGCVTCHSIQRIVYSTHTADEFVNIIQRMSLYSNGSTPETPQPIVPGPRQLRQAAARGDVQNDGPRGAAIRRTAEYLASVNLSKGPDWSYPLQTMARPKGRETHVIITTYDLPRPETMPHDAMVTPDGHAWYSDFGHQYIGELDPATGKVKEYQFPIEKPREPKGFLEIEADPEGNVWGAGMYQGLIGEVEARTGKVHVYEIPKEWQSNSTQESMVSPQYSNVDGKVWTNNQDDHSVLRLDLKTGKFENLGEAKDADGQTINGYGMPPDKSNDLYLLEFQGAEIGRIDATTKEVQIFSTPIKNSRPRRGRIGDDGNIWFAENGANAVGMFDPKTSSFKEWILPTKRATPYDAVRNARGEVWTGGEYTDRITRFNPATDEFVDYLMPIPTDVRRVFFDNARNQFWVGANHSAHLIRVEPLD
jgi:streptogramin lyase